MRALDAAKTAGAEYADVRISQNRNQAILTREHRVQALNDTETFGFGVRMLVDGAWGFAASRELSRRRGGARREAGRRAGPGEPRRARAPGGARARHAHGERNVAQSRSRSTPSTSPIEDKVALLLAANEAALKVKGARFVDLEHVLPPRGEDARHERRHLRRADDLSHAAAR